MTTTHRAGRHGASATAAYLATPITPTAPTADARPSAPTASPAPAIAPATYRIDPGRSALRFAVKGLFGLATVRGTFNIRDGIIVVADDLTRSRVHATIDAASIDTANRRRDADVRSKRYLDVGNHPEIRFTSREVTAETVTGVLTVHGIGQRVTLTFNPAATPDGCRFTASARIDRNAFGVTSGRGLIGAHLDIDLDVVATRG